MRIPVRRTAVAAVTVLAVGGFAAGCGSDNGGDAKNAKAASESTTTGSATTGTSPSAGTSPSDSSTGAGTLTKDNFVDALTAAIKDHQSAHMEMSFGGTLDASGDVSYAGSSPTMRLTMTMGSGSGANGNIEMRLLDGSVYMSIPGMTPSGKFLKVDKNDATFGPMLKQLQNFGPDGAVGMMRKGVTGFSHVGTTTIDGTSYEHYRITIDTKAVADQLGAAAGAAGKLPKSLSEDLYLDSHNLMRRATFEVEGQKVVVDATDWGKPVHVTAPPASDIVKMPGGAGGTAS